MAGWVECDVYRRRYNKSNTNVCPLNSTLVSNKLSQVWPFFIFVVGVALHGVTFCEKEGFGVPVPPPGTFIFGHNPIEIVHSRCVTCDLLSQLTIAVMQIRDFLKSSPPAMLAGCWLLSKRTAVKFQVGVVFT